MTYYLGLLFYFDMKMSELIKKKNPGEYVSPFGNGESNGRQNSQIQICDFFGERQININTFAKETNVIST